MYEFTRIDWFLRITAFSGIIPFLIGLYYFRRLSSDLRILFAYSCLVFVTEVTNFLLAAIFVQSTYGIFHYFTLLEYIILSLVFLKWQKSVIARRVTITGMIVFAGIWLTVKLTSSTMTTFDSLVVTIEAVFLLALAVHSFLRISDEITSTLFRLPRFWISAAVLIYFAGNLVVFALGSELLNKDSTQAGLLAWQFHAVLNMFANLLYAYGYWCRGHLQK